MPYMDFDEDNKSKDREGYPRFKMEKTGDKGRIVLMEKRPAFAFVHTIRETRLDENGRVVMEQKKKRGSEETIMVPATDFLSRPICDGNIDVVREKGLDPDNCIVCAAAKQSGALSAPERRFAIHILQYVLKPNSYEVATPVQVQCKAWVFGDRYFDQIVEFKKEWEDMRKHDLKVDCKNAAYHNYDLDVAREAAWLKDDDTKKFCAQVYAENRTDDLVAVIGRSIDPVYTQEDIDRAQYTYNIAHKGGTPQEDTPTEQEASLDVDSLLGGGGSAPAAAPTPEAEPAPAASAPSAAEPTVDVGEVAAAPAAESNGSSEEAPKQGTLGVEDILEGL